MRKETWTMLEEGRRREQQLRNTPLEALLEWRDALWIIQNRNVLTTDQASDLFCVNEELRQRGIQRTNDDIENAFKKLAYLLGWNAQEIADAISTSTIDAAH